MTRLVWMVLRDGRSVVASCAQATREDVARAIAQPGRTLTVNYVNSFESIPNSAIRDFVVFDSRSDPDQDSAISGTLNLKGS